jgi:hypothetical protein
MTNTKISLCPICYCITRDITTGKNKFTKILCGKCNEIKEKQNENKSIRQRI